MPKWKKKKESNLPRQNHIESASIGRSVNLHPGSHNISIFLADLLKKWQI